MIRLIVFIAIVAAAFHYTGYLDWGRFKDRLSGDKGVGDFYDRSPSSGAKPVIDKLKEALPGSSDAEARKPAPPPSKPVWSEGVADPKKMNVIRDDQRNVICFYPDIPESCFPSPKKN